MNKIILLLCFILFIFITIGIGYRFINKESDQVEPIIQEEEVIIDDVKPIDTEIPADTDIIDNSTIEDNEIMEPEKIYDNDVFTDLNSILLLVNKTHPLPKDYVPSDLVKPNVKSNKSGLSLRKEATLALEKMFEGALEDNITLVLGSSYRSYSYQTTLYNNYVAKDGEEKANRYSAKPGTSEHQTGLAVDISDASGANYLKRSFKDTSEGIWLKENAHLYGFILRYAEEKEEITGYMFEPWHFRYVGIEEATKIYESNLTFEEYYNLLD